MAKIICENCGTEFKFEVAKDFDTCPVCNASLLGDSSDHESPKEEDKSDWITWYYYGMYDKKGRETDTTSLRDKPIDLEEWGHAYFLIQEFKAPPESECGLDKVKEILRTYEPDAFVYPENPEPVVRCPRCSSKEYTLLNKGYSIFTGFLGSGRVKRVCNYCKKEF